MSTETRVQDPICRLLLDCRRHFTELERASGEGVPAEDLRCLFCGRPTAISEIVIEVDDPDEPEALEGEELLLEYLNTVIVRSSPEDLSALEERVDALHALVRERLAKWRDEQRAARGQALVGQFLAERCQLTAGGSVTHRKFQSAFARWCRQQSLPGLGYWEVDVELKRRGYPQSGDPPCYQGILIKPENANPRRRAAGNPG